MAEELDPRVIDTIIANMGKERVDLARHSSIHNPMPKAVANKEPKALAKRVANPVEEAIHDDKGHDHQRETQHATLGNHRLSHAIPTRVP